LLDYDARQMIFLLTKKEFMGAHDCRRRFAGELSTPA